MHINYFIVPGIGNSGEQHWQTWFESSGSNFQRINQDEWDRPDRDEWISTINAAISAVDPASVVLIGHSLGCAAIAWWAVTYKVKIRGAMLVAPSDTEAEAYTFPTTGFSPLPLQEIKFPTLVVASSNDQWVTSDRAGFFAKSWNSRFVNIGEAGHINAASGHYRWEEGLKLLSEL